LWFLMWNSPPSSFALALVNSPTLVRWVLGLLAFTSAVLEFFCPPVWVYLSILFAVVWSKSCFPRSQFLW
jgi:hypothetical protein